LRVLRPTVWLSVPRLLVHLHDKVMAGLTSAGRLKASLFKRGLAAKISNQKKGFLRHGFYDKLIFDKIAARLGLDRVKMIGSGSAPIAAEVLAFLRAVFSCSVGEGYGASELTCVATGTDVADIHGTDSGHVGVPAHCAEIKLVSVPEMGYLCTDTEHGDGVPCAGRGEICVRGPCVMREYYRLPEKTKEAIDEQGFYHTGDIGLWQQVEGTTTLQAGHLKIVDRVKAIMKLSQGEYVAPEKVENVLSRSPLIAMSLVAGNSTEAFTVAVVVPDPEFITAWAKSEGIVSKSADFEDASILKTIIQDPKTKPELMSSLKAQAKSAGLHSFEIPKAIHIEAEPFSAENGLLTATFKLRRNIARDRYKQVIDTLYSEAKKSIGEKKK